MEPTKHGSTLRDEYTQEAWRMLSGYSAGPEIPPEDPRVAHNTIVWDEKTEWEWAATGLAPSTGTLNYGELYEVEGGIWSDINRAQSGERTRVPGASITHGEITAPALPWTARANEYYDSSETAPATLAERADPAALYADLERHTALPPAGPPQNHTRGAQRTITGLPEARTILNDTTLSRVAPSDTRTTIECLSANTHANARRHDVSERDESSLPRASAGGQRSPSRAPPDAILGDHGRRRDGEELEPSPERDERTDLLSNVPQGSAKDMWGNTREYLPSQGEGIVMVDGASIDRKGAKNTTALWKTESLLPPESELPDTETRAQYLTRTGKLRITAPPTGGFKEVHPNGPLDHLRHISRARLDTFDSLPPGTTCLIDLYGPGKLSETKLKEIRIRVRQALVVITGVEDVRVEHPEQGPPKAGWDAPTVWLVWNLPPNVVYMLYKQFYWDNDLASFRMRDWKDVTRVREAFRAMLATGDGYNATVQAIRSDSTTHFVTPEAGAWAVIESVKVDICNMGGAQYQSVKGPVVRIYAILPTMDIRLWTYWRAALSEIAFPFANGPIRTGCRCKSCHGVDHTTIICHYDKKRTPGWIGATSRPKATKGKKGKKEKTEKEQGIEF
ncbi:hypothetical protein C2E23DRAFT_863608 [Lenzites betulinus]|nr:hypothetical protein C2E23DRAFT_863608 [Lenzites betulinus]